MFIKHQVQNFRHRGFQPADGSPIVMEFGSEPTPLNADGTPMKVLWDHDVNQVITVTDHQESTSAVSAP